MKPPPARGVARARGTPAPLTQGQVPHPTADEGRAALPLKPVRCLALE